MTSPERPTLFVGTLQCSEEKVNTRRITEIVPVGDVSRQQAGQARQVVICADRPEGNMLADLDVQAAAGKHGESGMGSIQAGGDGYVRRHHDARRDGFTTQWPQAHPWRGPRINTPT